MENYDPNFVSLAKAGDILVGGENFGTGSSREQAATALKYKGIKLVIAASFSETYKRNALNNGFLTIESPQLVRDLKHKFGKDRLTVRTGINARMDLRTAAIKTDESEYQFTPIGPTAQELLLAGGLEQWILNNMKTS